MFDKKAHTNFLDEASLKLSDADKRLFVFWCMDFLLKIPDTLDILDDYADIDETAEDLMESLRNKDVEEYKEDVKEALAEMDSEDDYYEIEILTLFNSCLKVIGKPHKHTITACGEGVIQLLYYFGQSSGMVEKWQSLLLKEADNQYVFIDDLINKREVSETKYHNIYDDVDFNIHKVDIAGMDSQTLEEIRYHMTQWKNGESQKFYALEAIGTKILDKVSKNKEESPDDFDPYTSSLDRQTTPEKIVGGSVQWISRIASKVVKAVHIFHSFRIAFSLAKTNSLDKKDMQKLKKSLSDEYNQDKEG